MSIKLDHSVDALTPSSGTLTLNGVLQPSIPISLANLGTIGASQLVGNPGTVAGHFQGIALGANLTLSVGGTLSAGAGGGGVTSIVAGAGMTGGTITTSGTIALGTTGAGRLVGNPGTVAAVYSDITVGSGLTLSAGGTLSATGAGTVTSVVAGAGLTGGTITSSGTVALGLTGAGKLVGNPGTASAVYSDVTVGANLTFSGGTLSAGGGIAQTAIPGEGSLVTAWTRPAAVAFSWLNQSGASYVDHTAPGPLSLLAAARTAGSNVIALIQAVPGAAPWTITGLIGRFGAVTNYSGCGLVLYDSGSGKLTTFGYLSPGNYQQALMVTHYTNVTTSASTLFNVPWQNADRVWLRINNDGTNLNYSVSSDAYDWTQVATELKAAFMPAITSYGFGVDTSDAGGSLVVPSVKLWSFS